MFFTSVAFIVFFIVVFTLYWLLRGKSANAQNIVLLVANYVFYAAWDWRFSGLLLLHTTINYSLGIFIGKAKTEKNKLSLLWLGIVTSLGCLFYFKYYNFFVSSFTDLLAGFHIKMQLQTVSILLPLGISFYTFKTIGYLIDVYREDVPAEKNWLAFYVFVSFFPGIIAGPIDKAGLLLPQLHQKRTFSSEQGIDGMRQILWGAFKKLVIADNLANIVNPVFENHATLSGANLLAGAFFYVIQIYADFSGYSEMAMGIAKLLGLSITLNFRNPFFAVNIADYWRRWHISLTRWVTDYVFTPLSFSLRKYKKAGVILAILINFSIIGVWHGANWTFLVFGLLHGLYFIPLILSGNINKTQVVSHTLLPSFKTAVRMLGIFVLVSLTSIVFRATDIHEAVHYYKDLFTHSFTSGFSIASLGITNIIFIFALFIIEWIQRDKGHALDFRTDKYPVLRWSTYILICVLIYLYITDQQDFAYIQF